MSNRNFPVVKGLWQFCYYLGNVFIVLVAILGVIFGKRKIELNLRDQIQYRLHLLQFFLESVPVEQAVTNSIDLPKDEFILISYFRVYQNLLDLLREWSYVK